MLALERLGVLLSLLHFEGLGQELLSVGHTDVVLFKHFFVGVASLLVLGNALFVGLGNVKLALVDLVDGELQSNGVSGDGFELLS